MPKINKIYVLTEQLRNSSNNTKSINDITQKFYITKFNSESELIAQVGSYNTNFELKHKRSLHILNPNPSNKLHSILIPLKIILLIGKYLN